jgi:hypothetical protein
MSRRIGAGVVLGGWVSWVLAVLAMIASLPSFVFYGLLFFTASVIGLVAMRRGRAGQGIALVLLSLLAPVFAMVSNLGHNRWADGLSLPAASTVPHVPDAAPPPVVVGASALAEAQVVGETPEDVEGQER